MAWITPRRRRLAGTSLVLLALAACNDATSTTRPVLHLERVQDVPPLGLPGARLRDTLRVRVVDDGGRPRSGQALTWLVQQGGGTVEVLTGTTGPDGMSTALWTLGPASGTNRLVARTLDDSSVVFQTEAEAFRVDRLDSDYALGCGLRQGDLWCWGENALVSTPAVSEGPPNTWGLTYEAPGLVAAGHDFVDLAVASDAVCALDAAGLTRCYGRHVPAETPTVPPLRFITGGPIAAFCGLARADSTAWCWHEGSATAAQVPGSPAFLDVLVHGVQSFGCGRLVDSTAVCWGVGPLGDSTITSSPTPIPVNGGLRFAQLAAGHEFVCGRQSTGQVWCWGSNALGQFGVSGPDSPVPVPGPAGVTRLAAAAATAMAFQNGVLVRWGNFGSAVGPNPPTPLAGLLDLPVVDFAAGDVSCVRLADGQAWCFEELWLQASSVDIDRYLPVQPVVPGP